MSLSSNSAFCLKYIKLVRETNQPFYSYKYWRFFQGCLDLQLQNILFPQGHELIGDPEDHKAEGTEDAILNELLKDHWFTLLRNGSLNEGLQDRIPWFGAVKQIYDFINLPIDDSKTIQD